MAGQRQPIELLIAKGKKHLTKEEIKERLESEVKPITDGIYPPEYLTSKQKKEFVEIANQLKKLNIMGETDIDALARYIISRELYVKITKKLMSKEILESPVLMDGYLQNQDRLFKQCRTAATDLGLTISSRCKLVIPKVHEEDKKVNKFSKFKK